MKLFTLIHTLYRGDASIERFFTMIRWRRMSNAMWFLMLLPAILALAIAYYPSRWLGAFLYKHSGRPVPSSLCSVSAYLFLFAFVNIFLAAVRTQVILASNSSGLGAEFISIQIFTPARLMLELVALHALLWITGIIALVYRSSHFLERYGPREKKHIVPLAILLLVLGLLGLYGLLITAMLMIF